MGKPVENNKLEVTIYEGSSIYLFYLKFYGLDILVVIACFIVIYFFDNENWIIFFTFLSVLIIKFKQIKNLAIKEASINKISFGNAFWKIWKKFIYIYSNILIFGLIIYAFIMYLFDVLNK